MLLPFQQIFKRPEPRKAELEGTTRQLDKVPAAQRRLCSIDSNGFSRQLHCTYTASAKFRDALGLWPTPIVESGAGHIACAQAAWMRLEGVNFKLKPLCTCGCRIARTVFATNNTRPSKPPESHRFIVMLCSACRGLRCGGQNNHRVAEQTQSRHHFPTCASLFVLPICGFAWTFEASTVFCFFR